ncbi:hypothetical protein CK203_089229 [Vitis vinifera]|uniref:Uncharacterized protein n=1 Tax=Vitis vinifera TaxID=29760 RepID=A0A438CZW8_VITVI|nr:hypothetical protein CK203_089229 [Vitis vinifera]
MPSNNSSKSILRKPIKILSGSLLWLEEIKALQKNSTWEMVELPQEKKTVRWVFSIKYKSNRIIDSDRVSFWSPSPSPKAFRSTVSPLENPHHRQKTLTAGEFSGDSFRQSPFRHRPYHQVRKEEIFKFCQSTGGRISITRQPHAFFSGGLNFTRRRVRVHGALSGNALPPPTSPDAI